MGRQPEKRHTQGWPEQPHMGDLCRREESKEGTDKEAEEAMNIDYIFCDITIFILKQFVTVPT